MKYSVTIKIWPSLFLFFALFMATEKAVADERGYLMGPRDVLSISIYAGGEVQQEVKVTVSARGVVSAPFIGAVRAKGLTVAELEAAITGPLAKDYFVNPEVIVHVLEYHSLRYFIAGSVKSPGLYETRSETSLMELIAKAGGALADRGNVAYLLWDSVERVSRGEVIESLISSGKTVKVDLVKLLDNGDMRQNKILKPGVVVYIPPKKKLNVAETIVYVGGEVKKPDFYDYQPGLTALSACIMAGGFARFAAPNRTRIIRRENGKQITIKINLNKVKKGKIPDIPLKPGDRIHVPETWL